MNLLKILILALGLILLITGCMSDFERRGVSNRPFNTPPSGNVRTFNGDF